jgi:hypothetical protein
MLYVGPVALKGILDKVKYEHYLLFHTAMYILVSDAAFNKEWIDYAGSLLKEFVAKIEVVYYKGLLTYNMHSIQHLHSDSAVHGPVDRFSAFDFENYMIVFKRMLKAKSLHLSQVVKRVVERESLSETLISPKKLKVPISFKFNDNCYITKSNLVCIVKSFDKLTDTYEVVVSSKSKRASHYPCKSSIFGIYLCSDFNQLMHLPSSDLQKKCIKIPFKDKYFCIPLCNSDEL